MDAELENEEKAEIIAVAGFILAATLLITFCLVVPGCCLHTLCIKRGRKGSTSDETIILEIPKRKPSVKIKEKITPFYQSVGVQLGIENLDRLSQNSVTSLPSTSSASVTEALPSSLTLTIHLSPDQDATALSRLRIHVIGGTNLPQRDYPELPNYCVKLAILHKRWTLSRDEHQVYEAQTRVANSSVNPVYNQLFTFAVSHSDIKAWCLRVGVWDDDRHTRYREVAHGRINLRDVKTIEDENASPLMISLEPSLAIVGQVLLSLTYLPTAQRLSINVLKTDDLPWQNVCSSLDDFRPAVKVYLLDQRGRVIKKKKLAGNKRSASPSFTGSALFLAPPLLLEAATVIVQVFQQEKIVEDEEEKTNKSNIIGFAAVGLMVEDDAARCQWQNLLQHPRQVVNQWHNLK